MNAKIVLPEKVENISLEKDVKVDRYIADDIISSVIDGIDIKDNNGILVESFKLSTLIEMVVSYNLFGKFKCIDDIAYHGKECLMEIYKYHFDLTLDPNAFPDRDLKFSKRLVIFGKKIFPDININVWNDISSQIVKAYKKEFENIDIYFSDVIDWEPGTFGRNESGSCYWGDRSSAKRFLMESGRFKAVKIYQNDKPLARCWLVFVDNKFVIFNCYSDEFELIDIARLLSGALGIDFSQVDLENNGTSCGKIYINSESGFLFPHSETRSIDLEIDCNEQCCFICGELYGEYNYLTTINDDQLICEDCLSEHYAYCDRCEEYYRLSSESMTYTENGVYCESCAGEYICDNCVQDETGTKTDIDILEISLNGIVSMDEITDHCSMQCILDNTSNTQSRSCDRCGRYFVIRTDINTSILSTILCPKCWSDHCQDFAEFDDLGDYRSCEFCNDPVYVFIDTNFNVIDNLCQTCGSSLHRSRAQDGQFIFTELAHLIDRNFIRRNDNYMIRD